MDRDRWFKFIVKLNRSNGALSTDVLTVWRRTFLVHIRVRQLGHHELVHSLATLETTTKRPSSAPPGTTTADKQ